MNKRAFLIMYALFAMLLLSALGAAFFFKSMSDKQASLRQSSLIQAFWVAEAGVAKAVSSFSGAGTLSGSVGSPANAYTVTITSIPATIYYAINATGTVPFGASTVSRQVSVTIKTGIVDATKFKYAIETTTDLVVKGSVDINPSDSWREFSTLDFANLFGISKATMEARATRVYTDSTFGTPVDGITWVNVAPGNELHIAGNLAGSGILVIKGDARISGTVDFDGIIYVIGELTITGTVTANGAVLAESSTTVDTELKGNVTLNYDPAKISNALSNVAYLTREIVSWREM